MSSSTSHPDVISPSGLSISQLPSLMARPAPKQGPPSSSTSSTATATAAAAAGQPPSGKPPGFTPRHKSTRAERACFSCHKRKIRCDVVRKSPCSNCHVDKLECTEREGVRARRKHRTTDQKDSAKLTSVVTSNPLPSPPIKDDRTSPLSKRRPSESFSQESSSSSSRPQPQPHLGLSDAGAAVVDLPQFIHPIPQTVSAVDAAYLARKGAFILPPLPLQNSLLLAYVEYVHPFMPIIDLEPFLSIVQHEDGSKGRVSLLLYHAILLSAAAFVDNNLLLEAGYPPRKVTRQIFFERARLLHDLDYEHDPFTLVQSTMLMTYWHETPDGQKDLWYWMGIAISTAHSINLHRDPSMMDIPQAERRLRKRLWWSCFIRDRLIALGARKPSRISEDEFNVPMLVESDFDIRAVGQASTDIAKCSVVLQDAQVQRDLALMCIAKAQLCIHLGHVLDSQYIAMNNGGGDRIEHPGGTRLLYPNMVQDSDSRQRVAGIDASLLDWLQSLPYACQSRQLGASDAQPANLVCTIQRSVLHMLYQTTVLALYRPQSLDISQKKSSARHEFRPLEHEQDISWNKIHDAAVQITNIVSGLADYEIDRLLPTTCVVLILPAMIIQVLEMKNNMAEGRDQALVSYKKCMHVMEHLGENFKGADFAILFLNMIMTRAGIHLNSAPQSAMAGYGFDATGAPFTMPLNLPVGSSSFEPDMDSGAHMNSYVQTDPSVQQYVPIGDYTTMGGLEYHDAFGWNMGGPSDFDMGQIGRLLTEITPLLQKNNPMGD